MIKGVNKRIIEVLNPEDRYFEKVILFLSPTVKADDYLVQKHASEYLQTITPKAKCKRRLKPGWLFLFQLLAAAVTGGICVGVFQLL